MAENTTNAMKFEDSMARIEEIVRVLERGDKPLEEALALFEEGTRLASGCGKLLDEAEQKVVKLRRGPGGAPEETPFGGDEE